MDYASPFFSIMRLADLPSKELYCILKRFSISELILKKNRPHFLLHEMRMGQVNVNVEEKLDAYKLTIKTNFCSKLSV
jgi:hypothetical protein